MEITVGNIIAALSMLGTMGGLAFALVKWVQSQVKDARTEAAEAVREARADAEKQIVRLEGRIEAVRVECARRDDIAALARNVDVLSGRFDTGVSGINSRIDQVLSLVAGKSAA